jgi:hypothetical protein
MLEVCCKEHATEPGIGMSAVVHSRTNRQDWNWRTSENFFGNRAEQELQGACAAVRAQYDQVNIMVFDNLLNRWRSKSPNIPSSPAQ